MQSCQAGYESSVSSYAKGGEVKETGLALVHKGEYVIPTAAAATTNNPAQLYRISPTINVNISGSTSSEDELRRLADRISRIVSAELKKMV